MCPGHNFISTLSWRQQLLCAHTCSACCLVTSTVAVMCIQKVTAHCVNNGTQQLCSGITPAAGIKTAD